MVWRCHSAWGKKWLPSILPILLIIASAVWGFDQAVTFARAGSQLKTWNGSLSLATNVVVTLIAFRIWSVHPLLEKLMVSLHESSFKYRRVLTFVIESGAICSSTLVIEITLYVFL
ncbi:hypothetical protein BDP27DRAFT_1337606, partial [Rhodocollybia butyracea]